MPARRAPLRTIVTVVLLIVSGVVFAAPADAEGDPRIAITQTATPNPVASGGQLTYTIDMVNELGSRADEVTLTDQVTDMTGLIVTSDVGTCTVDEGLVRCEAGSLEGFQPWRVTIRGTVTAANGTTLFNTASVTGTQSSQTYSASSTINTLVNTPAPGGQPNLRVSVSAPSSAPRDTNATITLTVNNNGGAKATDVTVLNTFPGGWAFVSATATNLFSCLHSAGVVTCEGGAIDQGTNATITIVATTGDPSPVPNGGPPYDDNNAVVDPWDTIAETNELDNTGSARTIVEVPGTPGPLVLTKDDGPDPLRPGDLLTYTLDLTNNATTRMDSVRITDGTQGLDASSITASANIGATNVPCTVSASEVVCTRKSPTLRLDPGQVMHMVVTGKVTASAGSIIRNTATAVANLKNKGQTTTATTMTSVRPGFEFSITQRALPLEDGNPNDIPHDDAAHNNAGFRAYDYYALKIAVGNSGLDDAVGVHVREPLPEGVTFLGFSDETGGGFACGVDASNVVNCTGGAIDGADLVTSPGGTSETIILYLVAPNKVGTISHTATVDPGNAFLEPQETNNTVTTVVPIITGIDLTTAKTANNPVAPSGTLTYTVTVTNNGTQDTTGVMLRDTLPAGVRFRSAVGDPAHNFTCAHDGSATGGTIDCVGGILRGTKYHTLAPDVATITIVLFAPTQPGFIKNQVRVDPLSQIPEIFEDNNINTYTSEVKIPPTPAPGPGGYEAYHSFTIAKTHDPEPVAPAGTLVYTITVKNHGSDVAFGVDVMDFLPEGAEFRSADDTEPGPGAFSCSEAGGVVNCVDGTLDGTLGQTQLANDDERQIKVTVFAPRQPGAYSNEAIVDPGDELPEANETDNSALDTVHVAIGGGGVYHEFGIEKTQKSPAAPNPVAPSGELEWEIKVTNSGSDAAFDVAVRDVLPAGVTFRDAYDANATANRFTCSEANGIVDCVGGDLDGSADQLPGGTNERTIVVKVFAQAQTGDYTNRAYIDPEDAFPEANETNNEALNTYTVALGGGGAYIDLTVDKTDSPGNDAEPLSLVTYSLLVKNSGSGDAFNVVVQDYLPGNATFVSAADANPGPGAFTCTESGGTVTCANGYLPKNNSGDRTITVIVRAPNADGVVLVNNAAVDPANAIPEASEINNTDSESTTVESKIDLQTTVNIGGLSSGSESDISFGASNAGTSTATNVKVVLNLPVGVIPLNVEAPAGWTCGITENPINQVTCTTSQLAGGGSATFNVHVYTTAQGETVNANSVIDPDNTVAESDENNNTATGSTSV